MRKLLLAGAAIAALLSPAGALEVPSDEERYFECTFPLDRKDPDPVVKTWVSMTIDGRNNLRGMYVFHHSNYGRDVIRLEQYSTNLSLSLRYLRLEGDAALEQATDHDRRRLPGSGRPIAPYTSSGWHGDHGHACRKQHGCQPDASDVNGLPVCAAPR